MRAFWGVFVFIVQVLAVTFIYEYYPGVIFSAASRVDIGLSGAIWFADLTRPLVALAAFSAGFRMNLRQTTGVLHAFLVGIFCSAAPIIAVAAFGGLEANVAPANLPLLIALSALAAGHAAIMEEVFFRGFALNWLLSIANPLVAVVPQALLFCMLHLRPETKNLASILWFLAFALAMSWIRLATLTILPCIVLHFGYDLASLTLFGVNRNGLHEPGLLRFPVGMNFTITLSSMVILLACIFLPPMKRFWSPSEKNAK